MVKIPVVAREVAELDEAGLPVTRIVAEPESPIPLTAVKVVCDGVFYTVYEAGDVIP